MTIRRLCGLLAALALCAAVFAGGEPGASRAAGTHATVQRMPAVTESEPHPDKATTPVTPGCTTDSAPMYFHTVGRLICTATGKGFVPYGISVITDLEAPHWCTTFDAAATNAQIFAASRYWHANAIRLQVLQDNVTGAMTCSYDKQSYGASAAVVRLAAEINLIESLGMVPIVNDDSELDNGSPVPTASTVQFWKSVITYLGQHNAHGVYDNVVFDLFNEPSTIGQAWLDGGTYKGKPSVGEQTLVNDVRNGKYLKDNLVIVEGGSVPGFAHATSLYTLGQYRVKSINVAYAFHHVNLNQPELSWKTRMGINSGVQVPILDGEWSQYASGRTYECFEKSPSEIPAYLALMRQYDMGMLFWSLEPGVGTVNGTKAHMVANQIQPWFPGTAIGYSQPDTFKTSYSCKYSLTALSPGIGAGAEVMNYFKQYSFKIFAATAK